jgi:TFIIB-like protein
VSWQPGKPSQNENEYFVRRDAEWLKEQRALLDARRAQHPAGIVCPRDGAELDERTFDGVRVDFCPACHGIWLDAGELVQLAHLTPKVLAHMVDSVGALPGGR